MKRKITIQSFITPKRILKKSSQASQGMILHVRRVVRIDTYPKITTTTPSL